MKKFALLSVLALGMAFTACDGYDLPNPDPQTNPQEAVFAADKFSVAAPEDATAVLDLQAFNDQAAMVPVGSYELSDFPAGYNPTVTMYFSKNADMSNAQSVPAQLVDGSIMVDADALDGAYRNITKDPAQTTIYVNYGVTATNSTGAMVYIGGPNYRYGDYSLVIKPFNPAVVIEDAYYIYTSADNFAAPVKMNHSSANPYDDPNFSVVIENTEGEFEWTIVPASSMNSMDAGVAGDGTEGDLVAGKGKVDLQGPVMINVNMEAMTFEAMIAYEVVYTPGPSNSWTIADSQTLFTTDYVNYKGFVFVQEQFKFAATLDWAVNWGVGDEEGTLKAGGENILVDNDGLYFMEMNMPELTYSITLLESCGVIGDATPGAWSESTDLTPSADFLTWTGTVHFGAGEWKIRFNNAWDVNLGGNMDNLSFGGDNIASPGEGDYTVTVSLATFPYTVTVTQ